MTDIPALPPSESNNYDQELWVSTLPLTILLWVAMIGSLSFLILCCKKQKRNHVITDEERARNGHSTIEEIDRTLHEIEEETEKNHSPTNTKTSPSHNGYNHLEDQERYNLGASGYEPVPKSRSTKPEPNSVFIPLPNAHQPIISPTTTKCS